MIRATSPAGQLLDEDTVRQTLHRALDSRFARQRVLVLIPDHTRSIPLPLLWRTLVAALHDTERLDFMVALGTHPPLSDEQLQRLVGIDAEERSGRYRHIGLSNHAWERDDTLVSVGTLPQERVQQIAGERWHPTLSGDVDIRINRAVLDYDAILILGPTFPHEVVGFSGGAKYLFPGISGADMINVTHWLGALSGVRGTIGIRDTPVRAMIHAAAEHVPTPVELIALTVVDGGLAGVFVGDHLEAWGAAVELSQERHIVWVDRPFRRVLSWAPPMYDELWTAGKAMYKLEPALAEGGELVIYAPHLDRVSRVHGEHIYEIGYHVLPYFLEQWERFAHVPLGVLAHSTHVRGDGDYRDGVELPRADVTLATKLTPEACARLALGYLDPDRIDLEAWRGREEEGILFVPKAGEVLYKLRE
jgi:nickel-dependent lactate racemase